MKSLYFIKLVILISVLALCNQRIYGQTAVTFSSAGTFSYTVPAGVTGVCVDMAGAQGGTSLSSVGGLGARIQATLTVSPGQVLNVYVGGKGGNYNYCSTSAGGTNGGGNGYGYGGGGGGGTAVGGSTYITSPLIAAGGGGGGYDCGSTNGEDGGNGGITSGGNGNYCGTSSTCVCGSGASASSGGAGATCYGGMTAGSLGQGGHETSYCYGGGGGGGYYGGGPGAFGGGGGGSSFTGGTGVSGASGTAGYQSGNGYVTLTPPSLGVVSGNVPICTHNTLNLIPSIAGGTWTSANTAIATVSSTGAVTATSAGSVNITYAPTISGCGSGYIIIPVLVNPSPAAISGPNSVCVGSTVSLTEGTSGGVWSSTTPANATIGSGSGSVSGILAGVTTISYTLASTGCASVLPMTVNSLPPAITGTPNVCAAGSVTSLGDPITGGTWNSSSPGTATVTGTGVVTGLVAGNTVITYTLPTGCMITQNVTVNPLPSTILGTTVVCAGSSVTLSDPTAGGSWSSSNTTYAAAGSSSGVVTGVSAGTPNISYTLATGCYTTSPVLVNPVPAAISGVTNACVGGSSALTDATAGGIWTSSNNSLATVLPVSGSVSGVASGSPVISYTLGTGCFITTPFVVNSLPVAYTVTGGGGYCVGASGEHVGLSFGSTGINYKLYNGSTLVTTVGGSNSGLDFGLQTAIGVYTVVAVNATTSCASNMTGSTTISINPLPNVYNVAGGGSFCAGGSGASVTLSNSDPSVDYQLLVGGSPLGGSVTGTGTALSFGLITTGGTYTAVGTNPSTGCSSGMSGSAVITVNPAPNVYSLGGGGSYCVGGSGVGITLSGSDLSTSYQLYFGGVASGASVSGTGASLTFGLHTGAGAYTVTALNTTTSCNSTMSGSAVISVNPLPLVYSVTGGGSYCAGGTGVHVGLSFSGTGINYQLFRGGLPVAMLPGTNAALDFGLQTISGSYTVVATDQVSLCTQNMTGSVSVSTTPLPVAYTVTGGGSYCSGGLGTHVGLNGSAIGMHYQLYNGLAAVGGAVSGTGAAIDFGSQSSTGTYTVVATNITTSCTNNMTGSAAVGINPGPDVFLLSAPGTSYCAGGTGIDISLGGSDVTGVNYQLYRNGTATGSTMSGTGAAIDFGYQTGAGTYSVRATATATGCSAVMAGSPAIVINPLPTAYSVTGGGSYCMGGIGVHIGLGNSIVGINYQLYNSSGPVGSSVSGIGSAIDFGYTTSVDNYGVTATNSITGCSDSMSGAVAVNQNPLPNVYAVTGGGDYCIGGAGKDIQTGGSDTGVTYQLFDGATMSGGSVSGSGSVVDFGNRIPVGIYTVTATNRTTSCTAAMSGSATIGTLPLPTAYSVTGGGVYCAPGGLGVNVTLSGSDAGVNYVLYYMGAPFTSAVTGTGSAINFGLETGAGTYNVVAINPATTCQGNMSGVATITTMPQPTVQTVTGGGPYCAGGTGVNVGLASSDAGIQYQLYNGATAIGSAVTGSGSALSFGMETIAGSYNVVASPGGLCQTSMTGSAAVSINALPDPYALTGGGSYCSGSAGTSVGLTGSDAGVKYQLYLGTTATGSMVAGNGTPISFGPQTTSGTYTAMATDTVTSCVSARGTSGSIVINALALPVVYNVTGGGHYCAGSTGVAVTLAGSATNVNYQLYQNGAVSGAPMAGTGTLLDFGLQTVVGTYTIVGTNAATLCTNNMADTATVASDPVQNPGVSVAARHNPIVKQQADTVVCTASTAGSDPLYQWYLNGFPITGATNSYYVSRKFNNHDSVTCIVTSNGGDCTGSTGNSSVVLTVNSNVGVQQVVANAINVNVVPNPNRGVFNVTGTLSSADDQQVILQVVDLLGHVLYNNESTARNGEINQTIQLTGAANGMYILSLHAGADSKTFHVVIEQ